MDADTETIRDKLVEVARVKGIIFYFDIALLIGLDLDLPEHRDRLSEMLNEIGRDENRKGNPFLPAIAIAVRQGRPGDGFFATAGELGLYDGGAGVREQVPFWIREVCRVHEHWARQ